MKDIDIKGLINKNLKCIKKKKKFILFNFCVEKPQLNVTPRKVGRWMVLSETEKSKCFGFSMTVATRWPMDINIYR